MIDQEPVVYVVDDDSDAREALVRSLKLRELPVQEFSDAETFLAAFDPVIESCLVLDYGLPQMNGLELQDHLIANDIALPIIFITGHGGVPESVQATRAGAVDFLEKPFKIDVLMTRIEEAFALCKQLSHDKARRADLDRKIDDLTEREHQILTYILSNPSRVTSKEIGGALDISPRTVDIHRARVMQKLGAKTLLQLFERCMIP